jgi:hypothetical protein
MVIPLAGKSADASPLIRDGLAYIHNRDAAQNIQRYGHATWSARLDLLRDARAPIRIVGKANRTSRIGTTRLGLAALISRIEGIAGGAACVRLGGQHRIVGPIWCIRGCGRNACSVLAVEIGGSGTLAVLISGNRAELLGSPLNQIVALRASGHRGLTADGSIHARMGRRGQAISGVADYCSPGLCRRSAAGGIADRDFAA